MEFTFKKTAKKWKIDPLAVNSETIPTVVMQSPKFQPKQMVNMYCLH